MIIKCRKVSQNAVQCHKMSQIVVKSHKVTSWPSPSGFHQTCLKDGVAFHWHIAAKYRKHLGVNRQQARALCASATWWAVRRPLTRKTAPLLSRRAPPPRRPPQICASPSVSESSPNKTRASPHPCASDSSLSLAPFFLAPEQKKTPKISRMSANQVSLNCRFQMVLRVLSRDQISPL